MPLISIKRSSLRLEWAACRYSVGLGLIFVILGGAELFTGNALMVMAWATGKVQLREMLRAWLIVTSATLLVAIGTAMLVFLSGQYLAGLGTVASVALKFALDKATEPFDYALFLGILCTVLAVWLALGARTTSDWAAMSAKCH